MARLPWLQFGGETGGLPGNRWNSPGEKYGGFASATTVEWERRQWFPETASSWNQEPLESNWRRPVREKEASGVTVGDCHPKHRESR